MLACHDVITLKVPYNFLVNNQKLCLRSKNCVEWVSFLIKHLHIFKYLKLRIFISMFAGPQSSVSSFVSTMLRLGAFTVDQMWIVPPVCSRVCMTYTPCVCTTTNKMGAHSYKHCSTASGQEFYRAYHFMDVQIS